jgi:hypothetical protein
MLYRPERGNPPPCFSNMVKLQNIYRKSGSVEIGTIVDTKDDGQKDSGIPIRQGTTWIE